MRHVVLAALLAALTLPANTEDSLLGTWRLNVERSEFFPKDTQYRIHTLSWELIGAQLLYREEGAYADGRTFRSEFKADPNTGEVKSSAATSFSQTRGKISLQVFGDDMLWVKIRGADGTLLRRWMVVLKDGGKQLVITQTKGGNEKRVYDRVE